MITKMYGLNMPDNTVKTSSNPAFRGKSDKLYDIIKQIPVLKSDKPDYTEKIKEMCEEMIKSSKDAKKVRPKDKYVNCEVKRTGDYRYEATMESADGKRKKTLHISGKNGCELIECINEKDGVITRHKFRGNNKPIIEKTKKLQDGSEQLVSLKDQEHGVSYSAKSGLMKISSEETRKNLEKHIKAGGVFGESGNISGGHAAEYYEKIGEGIKGVPSEDGTIKTCKIPVTIKENGVDKSINAEVTVTEYKDGSGKYIVFKNPETNDEFAQIAGPFPDPETGTLEYIQEGPLAPPKSVAPQKVLDAVKTGKMPSHEFFRKKDGQYMNFFMMKLDDAQYCIAVPENGATAIPITSKGVDNYSKGLFKRVKSKFDRQA